MPADIVPITDAIKARAEGLVAELVQAAQLTTIHTDLEATEASLLLRRVKTVADEIEAQRTSITKPLLDAKKAADDFFRGPKDRLAKVEAQLKRALLDWQRAAQLARQREIAEAQAKLAEEQAKLAQEAEWARMMDEPEEAERLSVAATAAPVVPVVAPAELPDGVYARKTWHVEVVDLVALVEAVAAGQADIGYLLPDIKAMDALARAKKGQLSIPGCRVVEGETAVVR